MATERFDILVEDLSVALSTLGADAALAVSNDYDADQLTVSPILVKRIHYMMVLDEPIDAQGPLFHMFNDGTMTTSQFGNQFLVANPTADRTTSAGTKEMWWETIGMLYPSTTTVSTLDITTSMMGGKGAYCNQDQGFSSHIINRSGSGLSTGMVVRGHGIYNIVWM